MLLKIPRRAGDLTARVWGFVLSKKSKKEGHFFMVVDDFVQNATAGIRTNDVIEVKTSSIVALIPQGEPATMLLEIQDGVITGMRRIDGKTTPIAVVVDYDGDVATRHFDHRGEKNSTDDLE